MTIESASKSLVDEFRSRKTLRAGSLITTVFGDAIAPRGGTVWLGSLIRVMADFGINATVEAIHPGPVVTTFEFEPAPGVKVSQITSRADDLALAMRATRIRIEAPIPGKAAVGIEIPNPYPQTVGLREVVPAGAAEPFDELPTGRFAGSAAADAPRRCGVTKGGDSHCLSRCRSAPGSPDPRAWPTCGRRGSRCT